MPSSAKMRMNKKSKNSSEIMDLIDASSEMTKFLSDDQYLQNARREREKCNPH